MKNSAKVTSLAVVSVVLLVAAVAAKAFFFSVYVIPQNGMYPQMPAGSRLIATQRFDADQIKRGDVVIFVRQENGQDYTYIWRVVALAGESVAVSGHDLSVDGAPVERTLAREADGHKVYVEQNGDASYEIALDDAPRQLAPKMELVVPAGCLFVMGDNRDNARDSRYFGPIGVQTVIGKKL